MIDPEAGESDPVRKSVPTRPVVDRLPADAAESLTDRLVGLQSIRPLPPTEVADRQARAGWEGAARRPNGDVIPLVGDVDPRRQALGLAPVRSDESRVGKVCDRQWTSR